MNSDWFASVVRDKGFVLGLFASFLGGLLLNLTPCVYPMIPVTLAFFNRQALATRRTVSFLALSYALGLALSYALLGAVASQTGVLFGSWLQSPWVTVGISVAIVVLSLSMFGVYELSIPQALLKRFDSAASGVGGAFTMGMGVGLVAAPCVGPFLVSLLLVISKFANPLLGFLLFFVLGLGMGLPSIILALAARRASLLPKSGEWLVWSKKVLGVALIGLALWFVRPLLSAAWAKGLSVVLLAAAGLYLGWLEKSRSRRGILKRIRLSLGVALLAAAAWAAWPQAAKAPGVAWQPYSTSSLENALRSHTPVVIDIYADWCLPCVELDHATFRNGDVVEQMRLVEALRVDVTREASPDAELLLQRYQIYGVPTVLFFDKTGNERQDLRVTGFAPAKDFLHRLRALHGSP